jgi:hypothetical protein
MVTLDITPRQLFSPSFFDSECSQINPTQATYCAQNRESKPKVIIISIYIDKVLFYFDDIY